MNFQDTDSESFASLTLSYTARSYIIAVPTSYGSVLYKLEAQKIPAHANTPLGVVLCHSYAIRLTAHYQWM